MVTRALWATVLLLSLTVVALVVVVRSLDRPWLKRRPTAMAQLLALPVK